MGTETPQATVRCVGYDEHPTADLSRTEHLECYEWIEPIRSDQK